MKKYKVLELHIGEDPYKPYKPGDEETGFRTLSATDAKPLIELGLLGSLDDDEVGGAADTNADDGGALADLRKELDQQSSTIATQADEIADLHQRLSEASDQLAASQNDFSLLKQEHSDALSRLDAASADLQKSNGLNADLTKQIEESSAKTASKTGGKTADKPSAAD